MPINIKDPDTDRLARELARATGEKITQAVATALRERLERVRGVGFAPDLLGDLRSISRRCAALPLRDRRAGDDILYNERGLPREG